MKKSKAKIVLIAAGILCVVFLLGSIIVQNLPEKSERKTKTKKETAFNEKSAYVMGNGYGSRGVYYKSQNEFLYYLDAATGEKSIVCTKTNCEHEKGKAEDSMEQTDCEADFPMYRHMFLMEINCIIYHMILWGKMPHGRSGSRI